MKENDTLAARFKEVREKSGFKQKEFAATIEISYSVISDIERGAREPSRQVLSALAELYQVDLNWLLLGTTKQNNSYQVNKLLEEIKDLKKTIAELENENKDLSKELIFRLKQLVKLSAEPEVSIR